MAETLAVIGLISTIIQFVDFGSKVVRRLREFSHNVNDVPKTFRKISCQLPLLIDTLERTQGQLSSGYFSEETVVALTPMMEGCLESVKDLEHILTRALPSEDDSTWDRRTKALSSLAYDKTIQKITSQLDSNVGMLAYHQATSSSELIKLMQDMNLARGDERRNSQCLCDLRLTDPRDDKSRIERTKGDLLRESYMWIFEDPTFKNWRDNDDIRLLWIKGDPGKGKTMLMMGLIEDQQESKHRLDTVCYFFCQATDASLNSAVSVLRGLIYLLVGQQNDLIRHIRKKYDTSGRPLFEDSNAFFALSAILSDILNDSSLERVLMMVDGLDECLVDLSDLLNLVNRHSSKQSKVKWLLSSRNMPEIEERLRPNTYRAKINLELNSIQITHGVNAFIDFKVLQLAEVKAYTEGFQEKIRNNLYDKADGTFLWVALVCKALEKLQIRKKLSVLEKFPPGLGACYERMMEQVFRLEDDDDVRSCIQIISSVTVAYRPISLNELVTIAGLQEEHNDIQSLTELVDLCGSFLIVRDEKIYFVHQSAKDYIINNTDPRIFPKGQAEKHHEIALRCLHVLSHTLKRDICNLRVPGTCIDELESVNFGLLAQINYACYYWVSHLRDASYPQLQKTSLSDNGEVHLFLQKHFLHWVEALSLMGNIGHVALILRTLECMLRPISSIASQLLSLVQDAKRFILNKRIIIEKTPLQVYASALIFTSDRNSIRRQYLNQHSPGIRCWLEVGKDLIPALQAIDGHSGEVTTAVFSPDGKQLASASWDRAVRLWDAETGLLQKTLEGHSLGVTAVGFLSNGQQLISSSEDRTVRIWDSRSGALQRTFDNTSSSVKALAISPDAMKIALGLEDKTLRILDAKTVISERTIEGHLFGIKAVAFSPNGREIASGSWDNYVRLWEVNTGVLRHLLKGHNSSVLSVAFSPNGKRLASASWDTTIKLWNAETGALQSTLEGHSDYVRAVKFSPDGQKLASGSWDKTIKLWNANTGNLEQIIEGHSDYVMSVTFSPNGKRLASASWDKTVRICDVDTGALHKTLNGYSIGIDDITLSPNKQKLALALGDNKLRLWDAKTGELQHTLEGHTDSVLSMTFSSDGLQLASASKDHSVRLWNTGTGELLQSLKGYSSSVSAVAFSSGVLLASASEDQTIRLWNTKTGELQHLLKGHSSSVLSVAFHFDGRLASASEDKSIRLWDSRTGELLRVLEAHFDSVLAVAFSLDGQLVSSSEDRTIRIWDAETGDLQYTLSGHLSPIKSVAFAPNGQHVITDLGPVDLGNPSVGPVQTTTWPLYSLTSDKSWLLWKGNRILWLPSEYRGTCQIFHDNILVTGKSSGRVTIITLDLDVSPLDW